MTLIGDDNSGRMQSSRIIVKNLPKSATEEKVKKHFSQKGDITDVKLKYNDQGKFRNFAFVGFKTPEAAQEAQEYFDRTYFGASRITVEICTNLSEKPMPKNKTVREKLKAEKLKERKLEEEARPPKRRKEDEILDKCEQDPAFMEFLQAHKKASATWGNDTVVEDLMKMKKQREKQSQAVEVNQEKAKAIVEEEGRSSEKQKSKPRKEFYTLKLRDVPKKAKKKDVKAFFDPLKLKSVRFPVGVRGIVYVGFKSEEDMKKALQKNKSIMLGNQIHIRVYNTPESDGSAAPKGKWDQLREELEKNAEPVSETGRIFIRNLPFTATEDELSKIFEPFGPITELHLSVDKLTRKLKGFGFITFMLPEHANNAFQALDGTIFQGRVLHLLPAKSQEDSSENDINAGTSYKTQKEQKLKKTAGSSHNWNTLFLGSDAVAKVISEKYGISREEMLLDKSEEQDSRLASAGVRMALAETEIVSETKKFLEENGVCLDAFDSPDKKAERSKTVILVKNIPVGTTANDIRDLFVKHGVLNRIILPPSGISALVEFAEPAEARSAFKKLAYSKFYNVPLYLEWAPVGVFNRPADIKEKLIPVNVETGTGNNEKLKDLGTGTDVLQKIMNVDDANEPIDENAVPELDTTLFVKNLNFRTNEDSLKKHFVQSGPVYASTVARRKDPNNPDTLLSMGYGFVQFYRKKDADRAYETLNGTMLDNHILELKRSARTLVKEDAAEKAKKKGNSTKILVRNVPFLATQEEITDLFKTFGKLKAVRLPKKITNTSEHRGFAFVEFYSETDAQKAFDTLGKSTHLYSRRLVLEWASQDESIEELRAKTARLAQASRLEDDSATSGSTKKRLQRYFQTKGGTTKKNQGDEESDDE